MVGPLNDVLSGCLNEWQFIKVILKSHHLCLGIVPWAGVAAWLYYDKLLSMVVSFL